MSQNKAYSRTNLIQAAAICAMAAMTMTVSACGGGGGGGGGGHVIPKADFSSCDQHPEVGPSALIGNANKTEFVKSEFFNKPYDRFDLEAVLDASVASTIQYVNSLGINLKKVVTGSPGGKCPNYFSVDGATDTLLEIWNQASAGSSNNSSLQGLFFEFCGQGTGAGCKDREMINPTILVNHVADRWTLVHELMHYNFNQGRKADAEIPSALRLDQMTKFHSNQFKKFLKDFEDLPNRGDLSSAVKELEMLVKIGHHAMVRKPLEEVAIEGMLIDLWAKGEFKNSGSREPSTWYMEYSRTEAMKQSGELAGFVAPLKKAAEDNFWPEISEQIQAVEDLMQMPERESLRMIKEAKAKIAKKLGRVESEERESTLPPIMGMTSFHAHNTEADFDPEHARAHLDQVDRDGVAKKFIEEIRKLREEVEQLSK